MLKRDTATNFHLVLEKAELPSRTEGRDLIRADSCDSQL